VSYRGRTIPYAIGRKQMASNANATVVFVRPPSRWRDRVRSYRLVIDGQPCGKIRSGSEVSVEVPAGHHVAQARIAWTGSPELAFSVEPGEIVRLKVEPAGDATQALGQVLGPSSWLLLSRDASPQHEAESR
jgi:hypothetical protein